MKPQDQLKIIKENTMDFINDEEFINKLKEKKKLKIKLGVDPSRPDLHLGHAVVLKKLKQFQDLGHEVILIIGDFTARIGDPSGKSKTRPMLTKEDVIENAKSYAEQAFRIIDKEKTTLRYNGEWFDKMSFEDVLKLSSKYTVARMLERDDFNKRYTSNQPISISEFLYPIAQGYDSVMIESDVEIGGTDQLFNLLVGRKLQEVDGIKPQIVLTMPIIEGTDGNLKMSKSYDNYIAFTDTPEDMFGKVMSIPDTLIIKYMKYLTDMTSDEIRNIEKLLEKPETNPRDIKMDLGVSIVKDFYSVEEAEKAKKHFINIFQKKNNPDEMPEINIEKNKIEIMDLLIDNNLFESKSEAKRMIKQGAVKINEEKISDFKEQLNLKGGEVLRIGKRKFYKIVLV
ncbi:MAG: tyrosine--tRNA ligase [Thermotogota bacterium]